MPTFLLGLAIVHCAFGLCFGLVPFEVGSAAELSWQPTVVAVWIEQPRVGGMYWSNAVPSKWRASTRIRADWLVPRQNVRLAQYILP